VLLLLLLPWFGLWYASRLFKELQHLGGFNC
jgi:hypothetical protein